MRVAGAVQVFAEVSPTGEAVQTTNPDDEDDEDDEARDPSVPGPRPYFVPASVANFLPCLGSSLQDSPPMSHGSDKSERNKEICSNAVMQF